MIGGDRLFNFKKMDKKQVANQVADREKKKINLSKQAVTLKKEYITHILEDKKLPIVLLDTHWYTAREHVQSPVITKKEEHLKELLKEQGRLHTDYKEYSIVKQNFMKKVLELSGEQQEKATPELTNTLDVLHDSILNISSKLELIEERLDTLESEIKKENKEIIFEMTAIGYSYIEYYKKEADRLEEQIEALRLEMLEKINQKKQAEADLKDIYGYLHNIIGREHVEVIDGIMNNINDRSHSQ